MQMYTKRKGPAKLATPVVKPSAKRPTKTTIDESRTSIAVAGTIPNSAVETISISSDADSDEDISDAEDLAARANGYTAVENPPTVVNGKRKLRAASPSKENAISEDEATSPSFGELLRGNTAIDVSALLQQPSTNGNVVHQSTRRAITAPAHQSLTTVLTQALRTDDTDLLESCLQTTDLQTIRNTIERIESSLAGILLNSLASRLYRRPGRAGNLMVWVQWTLIAHGGALASQPKVVQNLSGLQKVLSERARGLTSLLVLKGKLDLLERQMELRQKMRRNTGMIQGGEQDSEEDEDLIYVEGEEEESAERTLVNGVGSRRKYSADDDDDDGDDGGLGLTNNEVADSEDEEDASEGDYDDSDEVEESLDEDEVDHEDVDGSMGEEEESDAEAVPPLKVQKTTKGFGKRR